MTKTVPKAEPAIHFLHLYTILYYPTADMALQKLADLTLQLTANRFGDSLLAPPPQIVPHTGNKKVWCYCHIPQHRGSPHLVCKRNYFRHFRRCRAAELPFDENEAWARERELVRIHSPISHLSDPPNPESLSEENQSDMDSTYGDKDLETDEGPHTLEVAATPLDERVGLALRRRREEITEGWNELEETHDTDFYRAFVGTTRDQR